MEEPSVKYILVRDRFGYAFEKSWLGLTSKAIPIQLLPGDLFERDSKAEQPTDLTKVAVVGIGRTSSRIECRIEDLTGLSVEQANLHLTISSFEGRYQTFISGKRLAFGGRLSPGSAVFVEVKEILKTLPGVVRFKGELPPNLGTWFGVELL
ncbi:uncharacterized protein LOC111318940, partial [Stylophora pistillata]|uniref:uncharacterized protein LOC111318940 n=1 Tax=Stylophora pistillata TaxID=50429 RepID=UPI000C03BC0F